MEQKLNLANRSIGSGEPPFFIAEIGASHNGNMDLCKRLIDAAKACGVDAVKLQSWSKNSLISRSLYQRDTQLETAIERYQLTPQQHAEIARYCAQRNVMFLSTCFSAEEADLLDSLNVPAFKIASMDVNNLSLLEHVGKKGKPVILSTGMATLGEIEKALRVLCASGAGPVALLHCVSIYPPDDKTINLLNIATLRQAFGVPVGFSDHTLGTAVPIAAVALGACIIEKHFTLDKSLEGWDHAISANPKDMEAIVSDGIKVFHALGSTVRVIDRAELEKRNALRRSLVLKRNMKQGQTVRIEDLDFKRPGDGIPPDQSQFVVGRLLARDVTADEPLSWSDFSS